MMPSKGLCLIFLLLSCLQVISQPLKPGFDKEEYRELMYLSARTGALSPAYYADIPEPKTFRMIYRSSVMGLDNLWDLWVDDKSTLVISLRGTTDKPVSWVNNFYAAMVPAKGELKLSEHEIFKYNLSSHPSATVHVGWLLSTAFLSKDILPKLDSCYKAGYKNMLIMGHSQGGAIAYLLTSHLYRLQGQSVLPADIRFKTYCSAGPKPGNLYYAYDFENTTRGGWAFNVVNASDWVPETPISIQTIKDFNQTNPFVNIQDGFKKQKLIERLVMNHLYNKLERPTRKAQRNYEKYLGTMLSKIVRKSLPDFIPPVYAHSNNYVRTGATVVLMPDAEYKTLFPDDPKTVFVHHLHKPYLHLLSKYDL